MAKITSNDGSLSYDIENGTLTFQVVKLPEPHIDVEFLSAEMHRHWSILDAQIKEVQASILAFNSDFDIKVIAAVKSAQRARYL